MRVVPVNRTATPARCKTAGRGCSSADADPKEVRLTSDSQMRIQAGRRFDGSSRAGIGGNQGRTRKGNPFSIAQRTCGSSFQFPNWNCHESAPATAGPASPETVPCATIPRRYSEAWSSQKRRSLRQWPAGVDRQVDEVQDCSWFFPSNPLLCCIRRLSLYGCSDLPRFYCGKSGAWGRFCLGECL